MATPAEAMIASNLYLTERQTQEENPGLARSRQSRLTTSTKAIGEALDGGFESGQVHYITSKNEGGAQDFIHDLLATHLLSSQDAVASVIDCTLSLDIRKLHQALQASLQDAEDRVQESLEILDRLRIMKIFDYIGLIEAVAEKRELLEARSAPKGTIGDSEDEGDLLDSPSAAAKATATASTSYDRKRNLLIITNISQILVPLIKTNYVQGQATLSSFMRSLGHLAKVQDIWVLVVGDAHAKQVSENDTLSMFKSCTMRSGLGDGIGHLVDTHLYLHRVPRKQEDAAENGVLQEASVLEVVQDRGGDRYGRWAAFGYDSDGRLMDI